jgi:hypothetical protein
MRTLFVAAAAILLSTAAQAQEMVPAKPATPPAIQQTNDRALPVATPTSSLIDQLKAAGELKDVRDPKEPKTALEAPAPRFEQVQVEAKPAETKPVDEKKIEVLPAQAKPAETPVVAQPAEATPAATSPAAATTTSAKPAETKPVQAATETKPAKKKVVRKRETDEQKARRIAAKYGIYW